MLHAALLLDFKGADTLLVWGENADMQSLRAALLAVLQGRTPSFRIEGGAGLSGLTLQTARGNGLSEISGSESDVKWLCSSDVLGNVLETVEQLTVASHGHDYVDARGGLASQVLISVNEYPKPSVDSAKLVWRSDECGNSRLPHGAMRGMQ